MDLIKTKEEIEIMREGGKILARIMEEVKRAVRPGFSTWELNEIAESLIAQSGGEPSFKGFEDYPCALCTSINDVVVHGIPKQEEIIQNGDIVGLDLGLKYKGMYTDMAMTVAAGKVSKAGKHLIRTGRRALELALEQVKPGAKIGDVGAAIQTYVEKQGFSVVRALVGHGVGHNVHEAPKVPNFGEAGAGEEILEGMCLAIEPMICERGHQVKTDVDGWGVRTFDQGLAAHFEQTVVVVSGGFEVLTR